MKSLYTKRYGTNNKTLANYLNDLHLILYISHPLHKWNLFKILKIIPEKNSKVAVLISFLLTLSILFSQWISINHSTKLFNFCISQNHSLNIINLNKYVKYYLLKGRILQNTLWNEYDRLTTFAKFSQGSFFPKWDLKNILVCW